MADESFKQNKHSIINYHCLSENLSFILFTKRENMCFSLWVKTFFKYIFIACVKRVAVNILGKIS